MNDGDKQFIDRARNSLDRRFEHTPAHVSSRLNAARHRALDSRRHDGRGIWAPAMATAALVVVVVSGVWFGDQSGQPVPSGPVQQAEDFEMLTRGDDLALYADMDFYLWLDKRGMDAG